MVDEFSAVAEPTIIPCRYWYCCHSES